MDVAKITAELAQELTFVNGIITWRYNPVQDCNGNWIIGTEEAYAGLNENQFEIITWCAPPAEEEYL